MIHLEIKDGKLLHTYMVDNYRQSYDILAYHGVVAPYNGKLQDYIYESYLRNSDKRMHSWDEQKNQRNIIIKLLDDLWAIIDYTELAIYEYNNSGNRP